MRSILLRLVVLVPLLAGSCAGQISEMPTWVGFYEDNVEGADDVAVVVLKVAAPADVMLAAGRIGSNGWRGKGPRTGVWLPSQHGFVVARVSPTQDAMAYAVIQVRPDLPASGKPDTERTCEPGFWSVLSANAGATGPTQGQQTAGDGPAYGPTGQAHVPVLKAIARRVTYVGTLRIDALSEPEGNAAPQKVCISKVASPDDLEAVRRFLTQHYPKIRARVVDSPLQMLTRSEATE